MRFNQPIARTALLPLHHHALIARLFRRRARAAHLFRRPIVVQRRPVRRALDLGLGRRRPHRTHTYAHARTRAPSTEHASQPSTRTNSCYAVTSFSPSHRDARPCIRGSGVRPPRDAHRAAVDVVVVSRRSTPPRLRARSDCVVAMDGIDDGDS